MTSVPLEVPFMVQASGSTPDHATHMLTTVHFYTCLNAQTLLLLAARKASVTVIRALIVRRGRTLQSATLLHTGVIGSLTLLMLLPLLIRLAARVARHLRRGRPWTWVLWRRREVRLGARNWPFPRHGANALAKVRGR